MTKVSRNSRNIGVGVLFSIVVNLCTLCSRSYGSVIYERNDDFGCRSNETHVGWVDFKIGDETAYIVRSCTYIDNKKMLDRWNAFLYNNLMPFDLPNAESLGFDTSKPHDHETKQIIISESQRRRNLKQPIFEKTLPDGLSNGVVNSTLYLALQAKIEYPWTRDIPLDIYQEYVLNFVSTNEPRTHWRPIFHKASNTIVFGNQKIASERDKKNLSISDVVRLINRDLWVALGPDGGTKPIVFKAGQTPLIFDPMSIMVYGFGSCTGLSIFLVNALRSMGVPARLVGTPAWMGKEQNGNHNWVEVYVGVQKSETGELVPIWKFLEPAYGDYGTKHADNLQRNPCHRWFCHEDRFGPGKGTEVFAARLDRTKSEVIYPMPWCLSNHDVPGENRTKYYTNICGNCK